MAAALNFTAEKNAQFREILHNIIAIFDRMADIPVMDDAEFMNAAENTHLVEVLSSVDHAFSFSKLPSSDMLHHDLCKAITGYIQTWVIMYRISTLVVSIWEKLRLDFPQRGVREADNVKDSLKNASQTLHHIKKKLQDIDKCFEEILEMEDRENAEKEVAVMGYLVDVASVESKGCLNSVKIAKDRLDCLYVDDRRTENSFGNTVRMYAAAITSYLANAFGKTTKSAMASGK